MRIAIGCDHAGVKLKQALKQELEARGFSYQDFGVNSEQPADYPDVAAPVARAVARGEFERGILVCGTGVGTSIAANKVPGVRAALCHDTFSARASRQHNDANVLCLGGRVIGPGLAREIAAVWLQEPFSGEERHRRRLAKISQIEAEPCPPRGA
jgi:ribose 5-phosphate isomerase B